MSSLKDKCIFAQAEASWELGLDEAGLQQKLDG